MPRRRIRPVCNLYSVYTTQEAMRRAFEVASDSAGNVPPLPAIFPDQMAPVVRTVDGEREPIQTRRGFRAPRDGGARRGGERAVGRGGGRRARAEPDALGLSAPAEGGHPTGHQRAQRCLAVLARL